MCTVTWIQDGDRYTLFCNRDELRSRPRALPPRVHLASESRFLAPEDGQAGGTWIAANENGLSLCLLNDYAAAQPEPTLELTSRGLLVKDLIRAANRGELTDLWSATESQSYRPFKILALLPGRFPLLLSWNGTTSNLERDAVRPPLCSSSFDDVGAARSRSELMRDMLSKNDLEMRKRHLRFHQSHRPERGPYSVCMHRPDAVTVSFTVVEVDADGVSMAYADGAPCSSPLEHLVTLDRRH